VINTISSEILTNFDVLLIHLWLHGKIKCTIRDLYEKILPRGGLGTYKWVEYIKTHKINVLIIPSERDEFYENTFTHKTEFINVLNTITTFALTPEHFLDNTKFATLKPKTDIDQIVHKYIKDSFRDDRLEYWFDNLKHYYKPNTKLFINGFHLDKYPKSEGILPLAKLGKTLHIGMGTSKMYVPFEIKSKIQIVNLADYYGLSDLEKQFKDSYAIIDCVRVSGMFKTRGAEIGQLPLKNTLSDIAFRTNRYDFVVFIPRSNFDWRMYW